jgi:hypothetical protein
MNGGGPRRRRRSIDEPGSGSRLPLFPLLVVVVLAGLALGALLSRHFNSGSPAVQQLGGTTRTAIPIATTTPPRRPLPLQTGLSPAPRLSLSPAPSSSAPARHVPKRIALITPKPPPMRAPTATSIPLGAPVQPASRATPHAAPQLVRAATPLPPSGSDAAAAVARGYLQALMRGDSRSANSALGKPPSSGAAFDEQSFISPQSRISDLHATSNGNGTYKVEAEVASPKGTYFVTFQVARNAAAYYITDHYAIKVQ